jgi:uncharacterized protein (TIGR03067 family)
MPDGFQAEPPRWSASGPTSYDRYADVNLRRPEKQTSGVPWALIAVLLAALSVVLIGGLLYFSAMPVSSGFTVVAAPVSTTVAVAERKVEPAEKLAAPLQGSWTAVAVVRDGALAKQEDVARVQLTLNQDGFQMVLPDGTRKQGATWTPAIEVEDPLPGKPEVISTQIEFRDDDGKKLQTIFQLEDDVLKLCWSLDEDAACPTDLTAKKGSRRMLLILQRQKP